MLKRTNTDNINLDWNTTRHTSSKTCEVCGWGTTMLLAPKREASSVWPGVWRSKWLSVCVSPSTPSHSYHLHPLSEVRQTFRAAKMSGFTETKLTSSVMEQFKCMQMRMSQNQFVLSIFPYQWQRIICNVPAGSITFNSLWQQGLLKILSTRWQTNLRVQSDSKASSISL